MIKLYGLRMSNYYSLTKALLIEKGLEFEEVKRAFELTHGDAEVRRKGEPPRRCIQ